MARMPPYASFKLAQTLGGDVLIDSKSKNRGLSFPKVLIILNVFVAIGLMGALAGIFEIEMLLDNPIYLTKTTLGMLTLLVFVNACVVFAFGWLKTVYRMLKMAQSVMPDVPPREYLWNPLHTLFLPHFLSVDGKAHRIELVVGLKYLAIGSLLALGTFLLNSLSVIENAA